MSADRPPEDPDALRRALRARLRESEAAFDFLVQPQTHPHQTPIEDATVEWREQSAPFFKVATLFIPPQAFESDEQRARAEAISFSPWNAQPEHRPLGGLNRARRAAYEKLSALRHRRNQEMTTHPPDRSSLGSGS